ncbi:NAD(P)/FAD-dependent oxidoreductase [Varunaivibrio sulfuroxidans]|uniref:Ferredoxin--NADP reductase n=1 Tax=Varunaivibrio sulfuroxidans TaxID=1773489 RepID=A0A4R3J9H4_9PROT|nr:NAD(P)/FAD-dependent oxidoreductase [Varunaivibrio sulfuroxidans]TCS61646.1 thioredoxin reductase (NADPH) [Varunaivibrio sulfuroxidans]WES29482.1 NAD(P)/FAD-dependent oxidoreductase [Varunaivibrio sulfuroxidans]
MSAQHNTDVAIIGAGPVGLFSVFECGMLDLRCHVIDALPALGGQLSALYPEKMIYDIPGFPKVEAGALVSLLEEQARPFAPLYHLGQQVTELEGDAEGGWTLTTSQGVRITAGAVIVAAGVGAFGPNRPPLTGIADYEDLGPGRGVHYMVRRREDFRDKNIVIAGGGDSAVDWALSLSDVAKSVAVVHRRPKFRAAPESVKKMMSKVESGVIDLVVPYQLSAIEGVDREMQAVMVKNLDGEDRRLEADALLAFFGLSQNLGPIAGWGLPLERHQIKIDPADGATGLAGVFAAGDIVTYRGKLKLILTGFAEAAAAAHGARKALFPDEEIHFEHSTTKGSPGVA